MRFVVENHNSLGEFIDVDNTQLLSTIRNSPNCLYTLRLLYLAPSSLIPCMCVKTANIISSHQNVLSSYFGPVSPFKCHNFLGTVWLCSRPLFWSSWLSFHKPVDMLILVTGNQMQLVWNQERMSYTVTGNSMIGQSWLLSSSWVTAVIFQLTEPFYVI